MDQLGGGRRYADGRYIHLCGHQKFLPRKGKFLNILRFVLFSYPIGDVAHLATVRESRPLFRRVIRLVRVGQFDSVLIRTNILYRLRILNGNVYHRNGSKRFTPTTNGNASHDDNFMAVRGKRLSIRGGRVMPLF